jgi:uncharacterized cupredoxin-like copper-binding protein
MPGRRVLVLLTLVAGTTTAATMAPSALGTSTARVSVTMIDFKFKFSPVKLASGTNRFTVVNRGQATHDLKIAGKKTKLLNRGQKAIFTVTLKKGRYAFLCTVPGHARLGMKGTLVVR